MNRERPNDRGVLATLFRYEIKRLLRDTRMILIAVVAPLVLFPFIIFVMRMVERTEERRLVETVYEYALVGDEAEWGREIVAAALELEANDPDTSRAPVRFEEQQVVDADSLLIASGIHLVVEALSPNAYTRIRAQEAAADSSDAEEDTAEDIEVEETEEEDAFSELPTLRLRYRAQSDFSRNASNRLSARIVELRSQLRDSLYRSRGFPTDLEQIAFVETENTASAEKEGGALLGLALTPFLLLLMLTGGSIMAVDAISGEKERGTLETLLTTAAARSDIVKAKLLGIIAVGIAVAVINILNLLVYVVLGVVDLPENFAVALSAVDLVLLLVLFLPLTVLISSSLLLLSGYAKSYKEYQIYFFPLFLVFLVPSLAGMLPGMELRSVIALVPIAGIGVAVREIMVAQYDWLFLMLAFASTGGAAVWAARLTERTLSIERLISQSDLDEADLVGGPALFPRHVLRWFGVMWVIFLIVSLWFGEDLGVRGQLLVNLVFIFLGGSLLMVRRYGLDPRTAFALRPVHPLVWLAVLIGAPAGYIVGIGLAGLVNTYVFPVPQNVLEAFGDTLLGDEMPLWQLLFFLTIMPGILEELAFRGVLLHGLRKMLGPVGICLLVGAIFGIFHVSLFRLVPTAYLGMIFAAVVLLTGSIFPVMLWHFANNAIGLVPAHMGWVTEDTVVPWWGYALGLLGLLISFGIIWIVRTPYPDLKKKRPDAFA
ncbi:MAG TPA: CPBP family intramembrane metalloprotease [Gemmatimonadetes bacterium]|nr:CPBP family intramembrane metalloprotease [Gemmatimonadota bacterium]